MKAARRLQPSRGWLSPVPGSEGYRPDIDGLRGLAVASVVCFHAFPTRLPGGFVGVDIFFVISGFLISTILFRELESGTYSYYRFMGRRIRRILPALVAVLVTTLGGGFLLLNQAELLALGKELGASSLFGANILFWRQKGYFDTASEFKPLLHLWSLGVEEQFYVFYPPLLWLVSGRRRERLVLLMTVLWASFVCNVRTTSAAPEFAFFMLPARFWELLCGGITAHLLQSGRLQPPRGRPRALAQRAASPVGVGLMLLAIGITRERGFPGYWALLPVLGTCFFLWAGPSAWLNRNVFSRRPLVALGLISYPLYLWHWPLISFEHILSAERPGAAHLVIAVLLSVGLAVATYWLVERPLRQWSMPRTYRCLAPMAPTLALVGLGVIARDGFPSRAAASALVINQGEIDHESFHRYGHQRYLLCEDPVLAELALRYNDTILRCHQSRPGTDYDVILYGDSHAEHLFYGLAEELPSKNIVYVVNYDLPVADNPRLARVFDHITRLPRAKRRDVILGGAWALHDEKEDISRGLAEAIDGFKAAGYRVFVADDIPMFVFDPRGCKTARRIQLRSPICSMDAASVAAHRARIEREVVRVARANGASVLLTYDLLRDADRYFMAKDGELLYRDFHHLSVNGSRYIARALERSGQLRPFR